MNQVNYVFDEQAAVEEVLQAMRTRRLARECKQWRRLALASFGLFMASVIGNIVQFIGR